MFNDIYVTLLQSNRLCIIVPLIKIWIAWSDATWYCGNVSQLLSSTPFSPAVLGFDESSETLTLNLV